MSIDYARMQKSGPKLKAKLTRAVKTGAYSAVLSACTDAIIEWNAIGAWPDNWHRWQIALDDAASKHNRTGPREYVGLVRLESLL